MHLLSLCLSTLLCLTQYLHLHKNELNVHLQRSIADTPNSSPLSLPLAPPAVASLASISHPITVSREEGGRRRSRWRRRSKNDQQRRRPRSLGALLCYHNPKDKRLRKAKRETEREKERESGQKVPAVLPAEVQGGSGGS